MLTHRTRGSTETELRYVEVLSEGEVVTVSAGSQIINFWTKEGKHFGRIDTDRPARCFVELSDDRIAVGEPNKVTLWDLNAKNKKITTLEAGDVLKLAVSSTGKLIAISSGFKSEVIVWDLNALKKKAVEIAYSSDVREKPAILPNDWFIIYSGNQRKIEIRNTDLTKCLPFTLEADIKAMSVFPDGRVIVGFDKNIAIYKFDAVKATFTCIDKSISLVNGCASLVALNDGKTFLCSDKSGLVSKWDLDAKKVIATDKASEHAVNLVSNGFGDVVCYENSGKKYIQLSSANKEATKVVTSTAVQGVTQYVGTAGKVRGITGSADVQVAKPVAVAPSQPTKISAVANAGIFKKEPKKPTAVQTMRDCCGVKHCY